MLKRMLPWRCNKSSTITNSAAITHLLRVFVFCTVFSAFTVASYTRVSTPTPVYAATSSTINFQARLLSNSGNTVPDGNYNIEFNLYSASSGGTSEWTETRTGVSKVRVANGYLSVGLGEVTAFPTTVNWDQDHWLTMNVGGSGAPAWDGEMTPRLKLTAVPYAFQAKQSEILNKVQGTNTGVLDFLNLTANRNINLPDQDGTLCIQGSADCVDVTTTNTTATTGNNSGLEISADGLRLLGGCTDDQILKWSAAAKQWQCAPIDSSITVRETDGTPSISANTIEFGPSSSSGTEFTITDEGSGVSRVRLGTGVLTLTNYAATLDGIYVNESQSPASGDVSGSFNTGLSVNSVQNNSVDLGTDTIGSYVASLGTLVGLSTSGNTGEGSTPGLSVLYGSTSNTAVQGDTQITCTAGAGDLTGGGTVITLGTGGSCSSITISEAPTFDTSVTTPLLISNGALTLSANTTLGADDIIFSTAGTEKLRLLENGQLVFGTGANSANLYLSANDTLKTDDTFHAGGNGLFGGYVRVGSLSAPANTGIGDLTATKLSLGNGLLGSSTIKVTGSMTDTASGAVHFSNFTNSITPASNSSSEFRALYFSNSANAASGATLFTTNGGFFEGARIGGNQDGAISITNGLVGYGHLTDTGSHATPTVGTARGGLFTGMARFSGTSATTVTSAVYGLDVQAIGNAAVTSPAATGLRIQNIGTGNTITSAYGIDIAAQTRATTNNIGLRIAAPSGATNNYALQLSDTGGTAAGGITFGTDTNLYRDSGGNALKTDDSLITGLNFTVNGDTVLGDASTDGLTINSASVSTPNGLNFDSNTLVIDAANNRVAIGTATANATLQVQAPVGVNAAIFAASPTLGTSNGVYILAGTNSSDFGLQVVGAHSGVAHLLVRGDGVVDLGSASSGLRVATDGSLLDIDGDLVLNDSVLLSSSATATGLITANGGLTIETGDSFTINAEAFTDLTGNGLLMSGTTLTLDATTAGTVEGTGTNSGLVVAADGISLLRGCANNQILKWSTTGPQWNCAADNTGISDLRVKSNIQTIQGNILDRIKDIRIIEFDYNCESSAFDYQHCDTDHQTGVIAQELGLLFPELVFQDAHGYYNVRYDMLGIYNLKAVSQLAGTISANGNAKLNNVSTGNVLRLSSTGALQNITGLSVTSGGASISGNTSITSGAFNASGGTVSFNAGSNFATNINTGTSTGTITIGGGNAPLVINSTNFDVSSSGALSGITTLNASGTLTTAGSVNVSGTGVYQIDGANGATLTCTNNNLRGTFNGGIATSLSCGGLSDERLKENIVNLEDSVLDRMKDVRTVNFDFKCDNQAYEFLNLDCSRQTGVIAQELAQIFPELVYQESDGFYRVNYDALSIYNLKAMTEVARHIDSNGNGKFNKVSANALNVVGDITAGTIRADRIEGLEYNGRFEALEARVNELEQRPTSSSQSSNSEIDLSKLEVGSLIVNGPATFKEVARFEKDAQFDGQVNILGYANVQGMTVNLDLIVSGAIEIKGPATFKELARFEKDALFDGNVAVKGQMTVNSDTAGIATIKAGETTVKVKFSKPKTVKPIISLTLGEGKFAQYSYKNVTEEEFEIILAEPAHEDLSFSWMAISAQQPVAVTETP